MLVVLLGVLEMVVGVMLLGALLVYEFLDIDTNHLHISVVVFCNRVVYRFLDLHT